MIAVCVCVCARVDSPLLGAVALAVVVLHAEVVAHLVGDRRSDEAYDVRVVDRDAAGELVRADRALEGLAHDALVELHLPGDR